MEKNTVITFIAVLVFFGAVIGAGVFLIFTNMKQTVIGNDTIAAMSTKGINPIVARCAIDNQYAVSAAALCTEALRKETK
jgi:hypothetical protein